MPRALRVERRNLKFLPGPETQRPPPLRGEVFTCWCISGVTSESWSGFTQSSILRGEEWLGVMSSSQDP